MLSRGRESISSRCGFRRWQTVPGGQILDDLTQDDDWGAPIDKWLSCLWLCAGPEEMTKVAGISAPTDRLQGRNQAEVCGSRKRPTSSHGFPLCLRVDALPGGDGTHVGRGFQPADGALCPVLRKAKVAPGNRLTRGGSRRSPRQKRKGSQPPVVPAHVHQPDEAALFGARNRKCTMKHGAVDLPVILLAGDLSPSANVSTSHDFR
jgi:hypothetical protein